MRVGQPRQHQPQEAAAAGLWRLAASVEKLQGRQEAWGVVSRGKDEMTSGEAGLLMRPVGDTGPDEQRQHQVACKAQAKGATSACLKDHRLASKVRKDSRKAP